MKGIDILFEDDTCAVLNKPSGLAVQGGEGIKTSLDYLLFKQWGQHPFLVHRLDKDTSGLLIVAKTREGAGFYGRLFKDKKISRIYYAVCAGSPKNKSGTIEDNLEIRGILKEARTSYRLLASNGDFSLLELELDTGRMHQLRRHLAQIQSPVLGDDKYGSFPLNKKYRRELDLKKLLLHAGHLKIADHRADRVFKAPLPEYFSPFLEQLSIKGIPERID